MIKQERVITKTSFHSFSVKIKLVVKLSFLSELNLIQSLQQWWLVFSVYLALFRLHWTWYRFNGDVFKKKGFLQIPLVLFGTNVTFWKFIIDTYDLRSKSMAPTFNWLHVYPCPPLLMLIYNSKYIIHVPNCSEI